MTSDGQSLTWSASFAVAPTSRTPNLTGDKVLLPPTALEQLLAAAPIDTTDTPRPSVPFDPWNPQPYAAERAALAQFQTRQHRLPHPLTFRLVNPDNGRVVYAGIREFSAEGGEVALSWGLREALGIVPDGPPGVDKDVQMGDEETVQATEVTRPVANITVHARELPKGTYVKLRPLEAGYDPDDWKALLEQHLRANYTTLTNAEVLTIPGRRGTGGKREEFRFLVDGFKPECDGICIVDTDLEVDIEALNEEQARETLKQISDKQRRRAVAGGSSAGGELSLLKAEDGQVIDGDYVDYDLRSWPRSEGIEVELTASDPDVELDLYVSPFAARQRVRPREDEYVFADVSSRYPKRIRIQPKNVELEDAEALWVSVHAYNTSEPGISNGTATASPRSFSIRVVPFDSVQETKPSTNLSTNSTTPPNPDEVQCKNCHQWVPQRTLPLHENFCLRNNIPCPQGCGQVFQKRSEAFASHWHCPHDTFYGNTPLSQQKHTQLHHTPHTCPGCERTFSSLPQLASHRTTTCPSKAILCQFCHLEVPQEGDPDGAPNAEAILSNLTVHELADGARTTECALCGKIVRLRDMRVHLAAHELEKSSRAVPRPCRNALCGRTLDGANRAGDTRAGTKRGNGPGNDVGLCSSCFGPLFVAVYDPDGKALRRRVERRYLMQLLTGCGKQWCRNGFCRTGRTNLGVEPAAVTTKDAIPLVKPFVDGMVGSGDGDGRSELHFCVDEKSQERRVLAGLLAGERDLRGRAYGFEWCVAALEAENGDAAKAREWLGNWAPRQASD